jgi:hypothetical protein
MVVDDEQFFEERARTTPVPQPAPGSWSPQQQAELQKGLDNLGIVEDDLR